MAEKIKRLVCNSRKVGLLCYVNGSLGKDGAKGDDKGFWFT